MRKAALRILVVEDEEFVRDEILRTLEHEGFDVVGAGDVPSARRVGLRTVDLIVVDLRLPGDSGDVLIEEAADTPVVVVTAHGSVRTAVDAMRRGACDYLSKPFEPDELVLVVKRALQRSRGRRREDSLRSEVDRRWNTRGMVGDSGPMREVLARIDKVAATDATVLILGESGTGKELAARAIHDRSSRSDGPFVPVNCAAIPESLLESELFGHERGAFTGAETATKGMFRAAHGGTLFLDEIGETDPSAQARLLRAIQDRAVRPVGSSTPVLVDTRLVCATNRDLMELVDSGRFRRDLFYRIGVVEIRMPPLRERGSDILALAHRFLERSSERLGKPVPPLSTEAVDAIGAYRWPGNVRELENAMERALILGDDGPITTELLSLSSPPEPADPQDGSLVGHLVRFIRANQHFMSETELAQRLGISRKTLWKRRKEHGIPRTPKRGGIG